LSVREGVILSSAHVRSIETIRDFRASYATLSEHCARALDAARLSVRRFVDWLTNDQVRYWKAEIKSREKDWNVVKSELNRKKLGGALSGESPAVSELKLLERKARESLEEARGKIIKIKSWARILEKAIREYEAQSRKLAAMLDTDMPKGLASLEQMIKALEAYADLRPPVESDAGPSRVTATTDPMEPT
jgi:hypothetical protein